MDIRNIEHFSLLQTAAKPAPRLEPTTALNPISTVERTEGAREQPKEVGKGNTIDTYA
ncbi:hypothetical protein [Iodobacter fluviatilis]|uniref:Uncharacterized protein n=1 Tax=Iodobacter fluviatilis TaxID=537 RepID=A0A377QAM5_9NEIS|nr:hypothetical protein [Iodobacter fluviatilis]TCU81424.1 hypothetical protein EV682_12262 [Iodobacter fluviatilis]STQ91932.1 Uncharacterised protein [Iodobacter fluviatilis]